LTTRYLGDDLIYGVKNIAKEIKRSERQTRWLIENKSIRVGRMRRIIFASRSDLQSQIANLLKPE
jgi:hypothetical protein